MLALPRNPERSPYRVENTTEPTAALLWDDVSGRLREALNETTYMTWFGDAGAGELGDDTFSLVVPNDFTREWIEGHFLGFVKAATRDALGRDVRVTLTVREDQRAPGDVVDIPPRLTPPASRAASHRKRTRSTRSTCSSSARRTGSPTPPRSRSQRRRPRRTTRSSSTAAPASARHTSCRRSAST